MLLCDSGVDVSSSLLLASAILMAVREQLFHSSRCLNFRNRLSWPAGRNLQKCRKVRFEPDLIIDGVTKALLAAQISLCCLNRVVSQQKLDLLPFTTCLVAKTGTSPSEVMRRERRNLTVLCFFLRHAPNGLGAEADAPDSASLVDLDR